ncbi:MAG: hypothetical protein ABI430_03720 [Candidatus Taylorbacteria bacterium]
MHQPFAYLIVGIGSFSLPLRTEDSKTSNEVPEVWKNETVASSIALKILGTKNWKSRITKANPMARLILILVKIKESGMHCGRLSRNVPSN